MCLKGSFSGSIRFYRYNDEKITQILSNRYVFWAVSHLEFAPYKSFGAQIRLNNLQRDFWFKFLSDSLPFTSLILLYRKIFERFKFHSLKISDGFIFRQFFVQNWNRPKFFASNVSHFSSNFLCLKLVK